MTNDLKTTDGYETAPHPITPQPLRLDEHGRMACPHCGKGEVQIQTSGHKKGNFGEADEMSLTCFYPPISRPLPPEKLAYGLEVGINILWVIVDALDDLPRLLQEARITGENACPLSPC